MIQKQHTLTKKTTQANNPNLHRLKPLKFWLALVIVGFALNLYFGSLSLLTQLVMGSSISMEEPLSLVETLIALRIVWLILVNIIELRADRRDFAR